MQNPMTFKKKMIATTVASVMAASFSNVTFAQEDSSVEEVLVTGIKASLTRSMDMKREAVGVVDAINSEDIGKMPDSNLAESLQRITGVSIDRSNGEGSKVTVRGFGSNYNMVTLNGRVMPTNSYDSRAFDFGDLASESVSGLEVFKTSKANIASGGIGATINIKTLRPLDAPGLKASVGLKGTHDASVREGDDVTPEVSGLFSNTFADDTIGIALTGSYQERDSSTTGANNQQWNTRKWSATEAAGFGNAGAVIINAPQDGQLFSTPIDYRFTLGDSERTRTNGQLTLQYQPVERIKATVDYTYSENEWYETRIEQSLWFVNARSFAAFDNETVKTPILFTETITNPKDISFARQIFAGVNENEAAGFNVSVDITDDLNLTLDYNSASATNKPNDPRGSELNASVAANVVKTQTIDWSRDLPTMIVSIDDVKGNNNGVLDGADMTTTAGTHNWQSVDNDLEQVRLDGVWTFNESKLQFGVEQRTNEYLGIQKNDCCALMGDWSGANPALVPDTFWTPRDFTKEYSGYNITGSFAGGMDWDFDEVTNWAASQATAGTPGFSGFPDGKFQSRAKVTNMRDIEEEIQAAYVQFHMPGDFNDMPYNLLVGLRYEKTDITSSTLFAAPLRIEWTGDDDFNVPLSNITVPMSRTGNYDHLLPNLDFDINVTDDLKARFSASQTIARPTYNLLRADIGCCSVRGYTASQGNPDLEPLESTNVDISAEWYYSDSSYISLGAYFKDTDKFFSEQSIQQTLFDLRDATKGARAVTATNQLIAEGDPVPNAAEIWDRIMQNVGWTGGPITLLAEPDAPVAVWNVNTPVNNKSAKIHGLEFAVQHMFGESGFGVQANYTTVEGDVEFNNNSLDTQFALVGLSDTANLVGFYENNGWQARVAYNWRDKFLDTTNAYNNEPGYTEEYATIDANVSYEFNDNVTISLEGLNLTGQDKRRHGRTEAQLWRIELYEPRYMLGARYSF